MRIGLVIGNQYPPSNPLVDRWAEALDQVRLAASFGFDLVVFPQHYLVGEFAMLQPGVAVARAAAEAGTMRMSTNERQALLDLEPRPWKPPARFLPFSRHSL